MRLWGNRHEMLGNFVETNAFFIGTYCSTNVIDGCMRIHNFIVDFRNSANTANMEAEDAFNDYAVFQREAEMFIRGGRDGEDRLVGVFADNRADAENEGRGRRSNDESLARASGEVVREELWNKMEEAGL